MKKILTLSLLAMIMLFGVSTVYAAPWVYPVDEPSPSTTEYWVTPLTDGTNVVDLVLWNHNNNKDFVNGMFVIAIKSGTVTIDSVKVNGVDVSLNAQGTGTPGHPFPPGSIFPCEWKQYPVPDLDGRDSDLGWQGTSDDSGVQIEVTITVTGNPVATRLYFLAYGYDVQPNQELQPSDTPYSHITTTYNPPENRIPEVPFGTIVAAASMITAFAAYVAIRKRTTA
ncbi:MAG: hypothetical protein CW691_11560 [Candidatus Bathyarchaeum sp.]|nr:MAG: hypothetical protein CW691_11560 [Candidatus Bathyarchaeum sp.]